MSQQDEDDLPLFSEVPDGVGGGWIKKWGYTVWSFALAPGIYDMHGPRMLVRYVRPDGTAVERVVRGWLQIDEVKQMRQEMIDSDSVRSELADKWEEKYGHLRAQMVRQQRCYFIADDIYRAIKIGVGVSPEARLREFQIGHPGELRLIGSISGGEPHERYLHDLFIELHVRGEWFRADGPLLVVIRDLSAFDKKTPRELVEAVNQVRRDAGLPDRPYSDRVPRPLSLRRRRAA